MDISDWREKIDELDRKLVEFLSQRAHAAHEIGKLKRGAGMPIYEPERERNVYSNVRSVERQTGLDALVAPVAFDTHNPEVLSGVEHVHRISATYKLAGRSFRPHGTIIEFGNGVQIGGDQVVVMAGPCSVESREQLFTVAEQVSKAGARVLRGGAFKPRSSPYSFQGLGVEALKLLREAGDRFGMLVISEVMEISQIAMMLPYVDILQVGARNMQNFNLLRELGKIKKPVMLKRGIAATLEELLLSAEYIMAGGK